MNIQKVISEGLGELAGPHGSPAPSTGNRMIAVEIDLPARRGERRFRTEFFELTPEQYKQWSDASESRIWAENHIDA